MAETFSNIVVKTKDRERVLEDVKKHRFFDEPGFSCYISKPLDGYVYLFPSLGFQVRFPFTKYLSKVLETIALGGFVYKNSEISFGVFSGGEQVYRYLWQFGGDYGRVFPERPFTEGSIEKLLNLFPNVRGGERKFLRLITEDKPKKEELFSDILSFLGIPDHFTEWSNSDFSLLEKGMLSDEKIEGRDTPDLVKLSTSKDLPQHPFLSGTDSGSTAVERHTD